MKKILAITLILAALVASTILVTPSVSAQNGAVCCNDWSAGSGNCPPQTNHAYNQCRTVAGWYDSSFDW